MSACFVANHLENKPIIIIVIRLQVENLDEEQFIEQEQKETALNKSHWEQGKGEALVGAKDKSGTV